MYNCSTVHTVGDDLGAVECNGIELADVPQDLIESRHKIYIFNLF